MLLSKINTRMLRYFANNMYTIANKSTRYMLLVIGSRQSLDHQCPIASLTELTNTTSTLK